MAADSGRMRSLIDGVCINYLPGFATIKVAHKPKTRKLDAVRPCRVLLGLRNANPLEGWQICDWVHPGSCCHGCQSVVGATMRSSTNLSLYRIAQCNLLRCELCLPRSIR